MSLIPSTSPLPSKHFPHPQSNPPTITLKNFSTLCHRAPLRNLEKYYLSAAEPQYYPNVMFTNEETQEIARIETEVKALVDAKRAQWIAKGGVSEEWDGYVGQLKTIGLDRMVQIYQAALDRFNANR